MSEPKTARHKTRGTGRVFRRGAIWWIAYHHRGKEHRESSESVNVSDANALLKERLGEMGRGRLIGPTEEKVTFTDLAADFERHRALISKKSEKQAKQRVAHLKLHFGDDLAVDITTPRVRTYQQARLGDGVTGATAATVNRDCAALSKMFSLAIEAGLLSRKPHIPHLPESQPRQGFFERGEYLKVRAQLPEDHRDILDFGYMSGWRVGEILTLEWGDLDLDAAVIRLRPELSKNRRGRVLALAGPLLAVIERRKAARTLTTPRVFHYNGRAITNFRKRWKTACKNAGLPGRKFHDLRRTAVRNLTRAGVPERVAMGVTGHLTRSVFDRYNIVSEDDLRQATARVGAYVEALPDENTDATVTAIRRRKQGRKS